ncbi:hypothetical protein EYR40_002555 [Pleurotus pulmonarius]|nr:hypothetical protein EYR40_002555 [Pleurotus pulmonarius]
MRHLLHSSIHEYKALSMSQGLRFTKSGSIIKELFPAMDTYLLLFNEEGPTEPEEDTIVRLLPTSNYGQSLAYVVECQSHLQIAHLLVLPSRFEIGPTDNSANVMRSIPSLERKQGMLSHDYRRTAYGFIRGQIAFAFLQVRNISPSVDEVHALEESELTRVKELTTQLKRKLIRKGDRVRVIGGRFVGLIGFATEDMTTDTVYVMPVPSIIDYDDAGLELSTTDVEATCPQEGSKTLVIRGCFAGVIVEVNEYLEDDVIHAYVCAPTLHEGRAQVFNHEIVHSVMIGDYVEIIDGVFQGCKGYAAEDKWLSCRVYVDAVSEDDSTLVDHLQTWIEVDYNNIRTITPFRPQPPLTLPAVTSESSMKGEDAARTIGMEVYIVHHKHLKGTYGRIVGTLVVRDARSRNSRRFVVQSIGKVSVYTYELRERDLLESGSLLPIRIASKSFRSVPLADEPRSHTPIPERSDDDLGDFSVTEKDRFGVEDKNKNTEVSARIHGQADNDGSCLLDSRLMHRKLEIEISGTRHPEIYRKGRFEGTQGYTIITNSLLDTSKDVYVRVDSMDPSPMTRIPVKYLRPKNSTFPAGVRIVIKGATVDESEGFIGCYGIIHSSDYDLNFDTRLVYVLPSAMDMASSNTRSCTVEAVTDRECKWKPSGEGTHTFVFDASDNVDERPATFVVIGTIAQRSSELLPLGSYDYRRNDLEWSKWSFELLRPTEMKYLPGFEEAMRALLLLQRKVSQSGNNRCLLLDTEMGLGPTILFERDLFVPRYADDGELGDSLAWPVPYRSARRFADVTGRKKFEPLLAYYPDGVSIAPIDLDSKLRGSLVKVFFTLRHQSLPSFNCDHFHAKIVKILVLREGLVLPRPLRWNEEFRGDEDIEEQLLDEVWFLTKAPLAST